MVYKIYAKAKGTKPADRFGPWDKNSYKTREQAVARMKVLKKKHSKKGKHTPAFAFDVRKK